MNVFCCLKVANVDASLSIGGLIDTVDVLREDLVGWTAEISWVAKGRFTHVLVIVVNSIINNHKSDIIFIY